MYLVAVHDRYTHAELARQYYGSVRNALFGRIELMTAWRGRGIVTSPRKLEYRYN